MNQETLIKQIEAKSGRSAEEINDVLELILDEIGSVLSGGESVSLGGYGVFVPRLDYAAQRREKRHSMTGVWRADTGAVGWKTVEFKARKDFLALINARPTRKTVVTNAEQEQFG